jgi:hypothetical protein
LGVIHTFCIVYLYKEKKYANQKNYFYYKSADKKNITLAKIIKIYKEFCKKL